jgi:hypothetical protein
MIRYARGNTGHFSGLVYGEELRKYRVSWRAPTRFCTAGYMAERAVCR